MMNDSEVIMLRKNDIAKIVCAAIKNINGVCYDAELVGCDGCGSCNVCQSATESLIKNRLNHDADIGILDLSKSTHAIQIEHQLGPNESEDDKLCEGCIAKDCEICPYDDNYHCHGCPCDTCEVVDGKRTNYHTN